MIRYNIPYEAPQNQRDALSEKRKKTVTLKNHRNCSLRMSTFSRAIHSIPMVGYVTAVLVLIRAELCALEEAITVSVFKKNDLLRFHCILSLFFFLEQTLVLICAWLGVV